MHVARIVRHYKGKRYVTTLLRTSFRDHGKVKHRTLGNLSHLPEHVIDLIRRSLQGEAFTPADEAIQTLSTLPHGHVEAVLGTIRKLGLATIISSTPSRQRDLVVALIAERLLFPCSKLATTRHWLNTTLARELGVADADTKELYQAMDWLLKRQPAIEAKLARRHLEEKGLVLYDVSSSYYFGHLSAGALRTQSRWQKRVADHRLWFVDRCFGSTDRRAGLPGQHGRSDDGARSSPQGA